MGRHFFKLYYLFALFDSIKHYLKYGFFISSDANEELHWVIYNLNSMYMYTLFGTHFFGIYQKYLHKNISHQKYVAQ